MSYLPNNPILGKLEITEVYEFYDRPILFTCQNVTGQYYIAVWIEENESDDVWLYAPMSRGRFEVIRSGGIDLYSAFRHAENNFVWQVTTPYDNHDDTVVALSCSSLTEDQLPMEGEFLSLSTATLPPETVNIEQRAIQSRREHIALHVESSEYTRSEIAADKLGDLLVSFQKVLNNIGSKIKNNKISSRGALEAEVLTKMQLNVVGFAPGSFEVQLASIHDEGMADLFDDYLVGKAMQEIIKLINLSGNAEDVKNYILNLGPRVINSYVEFIEHIILNVDEIKFKWRSPHPERGGDGTITSKQAENIAETLKKFEQIAEKELIHNGTLVGANLRTMKFDFDIGQISTITGDIDKSAYKALDGAILNHKYKATIREITTFKATKEQETTQYILYKLESQ